MMTAKVFENGRSQAVRLPKDYRFSMDEVLISRVGKIVRDCKVKCVSSED